MELLLVITIMIILAISAIGAINPIAQVNKGNDAKRKKDMGRIKIAMEDYYNDKGCYPGQVLIDTLNEANSCGKNVFTPWLASWPCDSQGKPYGLAVEAAINPPPPLSCPKWFKVFTKLDNKKDAGIPQGWTTGIEYVGSFANVYSHSQVNYGMSSTNVRWDEKAAPSGCGPGCSSHGSGDCNTADGIPPSCSGDDCYLGSNCASECQFTCCNDGHPCD